MRIPDPFRSGDWLSGSQFTADLPVNHTDLAMVTTTNP